MLRKHRREKITPKEAASVTRLVDQGQSGTVPRTADKGRREGGYRFAGCRQTDILLPFRRARAHPASPEDARRWKNLGALRV